MNPYSSGAVANGCLIKRMQAKLCFLSVNRNFCASVQKRSVSSHKQEQHYLFGEIIVCMKKEFYWSELFFLAKCHSTLPLLLLF